MRELPEHISESPPAGAPTEVPEQVPIVAQVSASTEHSKTWRDLRNAFHAVRTLAEPASETEVEILNLSTGATSRVIVLHRASMTGFHWTGAQRVPTAGRLGGWRAGVGAKTTMMASANLATPFGGHRYLPFSFVPLSFGSMVERSGVAQHLDDPAWLQKLRAFRHEMDRKGRGRYPSGAPRCPSPSLVLEGCRLPTIVLVTCAGSSSRTCTASWSSCSTSRSGCGPSGGSSTRSTAASAVTSTGRCRARGFDRSIQPTQL